MLPTTILDRCVEDVKQRLFFQLVAVMTVIATRTYFSAHSAYLTMKDRFSISPAGFCEKLHHAESQFASIMIHQAAADPAKVIDSMLSAKMVILPGLEAFYQAQFDLSHS